MLWFFFFILIDSPWTIIPVLRNVYSRTHILYVCVLVYEQNDWYIRISRINYRRTYRVGHCANFPFPSST